MIIKYSSWVPVGGWVDFYVVMESRKLFAKPSHEDTDVLLTMFTYVANSARKALSDLF